MGLERRARAWNEEFFADLLAPLFIAGVALGCSKFNARPSEKLERKVGTGRE
jgi:hypothetical protein